MRSRAILIRQLLADGIYVVDEFRAANAILARVALRACVAEPELRNETRSTVVRSFRPDQRARSFRLERSANFHRR